MADSGNSSWCNRIFFLLFLLLSYTDNVHATRTRTAKELLFWSDFFCWTLAS